MAHTEPRQAESDEALFAESRKKGYEVRDTNVRQILLWGVVLSVLMGVSVLGLIPYIAYETKRHLNSFARPSAMSHLRGKAPEPMLQATTRQHRLPWQAKETTKLNSYGWVNKDAGVVRVPIEVAMGRVARDGLPQFGASKVPSSAPAGVPAEPSKLQGEPGAPGAPGNVPAIGVPGGGPAPVKNHKGAAKPQ